MHRTRIIRSLLGVLEAMGTILSLLGVLAAIGVLLFVLFAGGPESADFEGRFRTYLQTPMGDLACDQGTTEEPMDADVAFVILEAMAQLSPLRVATIMEEECR